MIAVIGEAKTQNEQIVSKRKSYFALCRQVFYVLSHCLFYTYERVQMWLRLC